MKHDLRLPTFSEYIRHFEAVVETMVKVVYHIPITRLGKSPRTVTNNSVTNYAYQFNDFVLL